MVFFFFHSRFRVGLARCHGFVTAHRDTGSSCTISIQLLENNVQLTMILWPHGSLSPLCFPVKPESSYKIIPTVLSLIGISRCRFKLNTASTSSLQVRYQCPRLIILPMSLNSSMIGLLVTYPHVYQILAILSFGCMLLFGRFKLNLGRRNPKGLPLPPGPKGLPLIGNLFDFPTNHQWLVYDEWQKTYGTMYFAIDWPLQE